MSRLQQRLAPSVSAGRLAAPQLAALLQALAELGARSAPLLPALEQQLLRQCSAAAEPQAGADNTGCSSGSSSGLSGGQLVATLLALGELQRRGAVSELFRCGGSCAQKLGTDMCLCIRCVWRVCGRGHMCVCVCGVYRIVCMCACLGL